ncbi:hypothetical protein PG996_001464 [Apiospora saccharicola]|uniref:Uncharacterized protein n=1 Tax=Apiospora saccharicola TaxID=335842 RepID=A0ABR1WKX4_9PEZI
MDPINAQETTTTRVSNTDSASNWGDLRLAPGGLWASPSGPSAMSTAARQACSSSSNLQDPVSRLFLPLFESLPPDKTILRVHLHAARSKRRDLHAERVRNPEEVVAADRVDRRGIHPNVLPGRMCAPFGEGVVGPGLQAAAASDPRVVISITACAGRR